MSLFSRFLALFGREQARTDQPSQIIDESNMNEGDFHSGPGGYTPSSGYQDTFYGNAEYLISPDEEEGDYSGGLDEGGYR